MRPLPAASTPTPSSARHGSHWRAGDHRHHRYQSSSSATIIEDGLCRASYELPPSSAKHRGTGPLAVTTELSGYPSPQETYTNTTLDRDSDDEYDLMGGDDHGEDDGVNYEAAEDEGEGKSSPVDMRERFLRNRSMFEVVQQVQEDGRRGPGDDVEIQRPRKDVAPARSEPQRKETVTSPNVVSSRKAPQPQPAASTRLYNLPHTRRSPSPSPTRTPRDRNPYARKRSSSEGRYDKQIAAAPDTIAPYLVRHRPTDSTDEEEEEVALRRRGASEDESEDDSEGDDKDNSDDDSEDDSESEEETTTRGGRAAGSVIHAVSVDGLRSQFEKLGASILPPQPIATAAAAVARLASVRIQRAAEEAEEDHREERGHRTRVVRVEVPREADRRRSSPERVLRGVSRERGAEAPAASDESGRVESSSRLDALLDEERRREREHKEEMRRRKEEEDRLAAAAEMARLNMEEEEAKRQRKREREAKQQEREARRRAEEAERERIEREAWRAAERERIERVVEEERIRREERAQMEREAQDREERKLRDKAEAETAARVKAEDEARRLRAVAAQKDAEAKRLAADLEATQRVNLALMERMQQQQQPIAPAQTLAIAALERQSQDQARMAFQAQALQSHLQTQSLAAQRLHAQSIQQHALQPQAGASNAFTPYPTFYNSSSPAQQPSPKVHISTAAGQTTVMPVHRNRTKRPLPSPPERGAGLVDGKQRDRSWTNMEVDIDSTSDTSSSEVALPSPPRVGRRDKSSTRVKSRSKSRARALCSEASVSNSPVSKRDRRLDGDSEVESRSRNRKNNHQAPALSQQGTGSSKPVEMVPATPSPIRVKKKNSQPTSTNFMTTHATRQLPVTPNSSIARPDEVYSPQSIPTTPSPGRHRSIDKGYLTPEHHRPTSASPTVPGRRLRHRPSLTNTYERSHGQPVPVRQHTLPVTPPSSDQSPLRSSHSLDSPLHAHRSQPTLHREEPDPCMHSASPWDRARAPSDIGSALLRDDIEPGMDAATFLKAKRRRERLQQEGGGAQADANLRRARSKVRRPAAPAAVGSASPAVSRTSSGRGNAGVIGGGPEVSSSNSSREAGGGREKRGWRSSLVGKNVGEVLEVRELH